MRLAKGLLESCVTVPFDYKCSAVEKVGLITHSRTLQVQAVNRFNVTALASRRTKLMLVYASMCATRKSFLNFAIEPVFAMTQDVYCLGCGLV